MNNQLKKLSFLAILLGRRYVFISLDCKTLALIPSTMTSLEIDMNNGSLWGNLSSPIHTVTKLGNTFNIAWTLSATRISTAPNQ